MRTGSCVPKIARTPAARVVRVHVLLLREGQLGRLHVGALHQAHSGAHPDEVVEIAGGPAQVGLHADPDVRVALPDLPVEAESDLGVGRGLHVDPDPGPQGGGAPGEGGHVLLALVAVEIEPELRQLDRDLGVEAGRLDAIERAQVVARDFGGLGGRRQVLAEAGQDRTRAGRLEASRSRDRRFEVLARHETRHGAPDRARARRPRPQPAALRAGEEDVAQESHRLRRDDRRPRRGLSTPPERGGH
jgi:hypothetical protein